MKGKRLALIARAIAIYITVAGIWILLFEYLMHKYVTDPVYLSAVGYYEDWVFIFISAIFLGVVLKHELETHEVTEQKYQNIFEHAIEGIFRSTLDGHFISVNPSMARLYGYDSAEEMIESVEDIGSQLYVNPQARQRFINELLVNGSIEKFESQDYRKDGTIFWTSVNARVAKDKTGNPLYLDGFATDITGQKKFQAALEEAESRYRSLVEEVPAAVYTQDLEDNLNSGLYISPQVEMISGYSAAEWMETYGFWPNIIHSEDRKLYIEENDRTNKTLETFDLEYRIVARDGRIVWLRDISRVAHDEGGKPLYWQGILLDITERKLTEQKIEASEERYRTVIEQAADGIFISDTEGNYNDVNSSGCAMLGYTREEILHMNMRDLIPHEEIHTKPLRLREIRNGKSVVTQRKLRRKDGSTTAVEISEKSLQDGRLLGIVRDITERVQAEEVRAREQKRFQSLIEHSTDAIGLYSADGEILYESPAIEKIIGFLPQEVEGKKIFDFLHPDDLERAHKTQQTLLDDPNATIIFETRRLHKNGTYRWLEFIITNRFQEPGIQALVSNFRDVTERKLAESALQEREDQYRQLVEHSPYAIAVHSQGALVYLNQAGVRLMRANSAEELYGTPIINFVHPASRPRALKRLQELNTGKEVSPLEEKFLRQDGTTVDVEVAAYSLIYQNKSAVQVVIRDLTEQKRSQEAIRSNEEKLRAIVDHTRNIYYSHSPENMLTYMSEQTRNILGYEPEEALINWQNFLTDHLVNQRGLMLTQKAIDTGESQEPYVLELKAKDGRRVWVEVRETPIVRDGKTISIVGALTDITERKEAEKKLERHLAELTVLHAVAMAASQGQSENEVIGRTNQIVSGMLYPENCGVLLLNQEGDALRPHLSYWGVPQERIIEELTLSRGITGKVASTGRALRINDVKTEPAYIETTEGVCSELCVPIRVNEKIIGVFNAESRKENTFDEEDERVLTTIAGTLGTAIERIRLFEAEQKRRKDAEYLREATFALTTSLEPYELYEIILDAVQKLIPHNSASIELLHDDRYFEIVAGRGFSSADSHIGTKYASTPERWEKLETIRTPIIIPDIQKDDRFTKLNGTEYIHGWMGVPLHARNKLIGFINLDSTVVGFYTEEHAALAQTLGNQAAIAIENAFLYKSEQRRHQEAEQLRQAATAVASSLKLKEVLGLLLSALKDVVPFDSASILLPEGEHVRIVAAHGLPNESQVINKLFPADNQLLQHILANGQSLILEDAQLDSRFERWATSDIVRGWMGVPMIARGQVIGFITLDSFTQGIFNAGTAELAQSFAHQAAIAIENARLFENLQKTNLELSQAYDTTLEGWGKALELRDKVTQGHTERVAELTLKLARRMGFGKEALVQIRRGVLLHDIGKMGVPDHILNKKGPLTKKEWEEMRKHPQHAFDLLYPITYLRPSLDIAFCHHEWWDGSGYPRGLKGEQIPLSARIFAVVDVWDALLFDRPYRKAWTKKKTIKIILEQSSSHFDPSVVEIFLKMIEDDAKK